VFWKNGCFGCGVFVVKLWWNACNLWWVDGLFLVLKNMPWISILFSRFPKMGKVPFLKGQEGVVKALSRPGSAG
jgi:hypothetical protein